MPARLIAEYLLASGVSAIGIIRGVNGYSYVMGRYATEIESPDCPVYWLESKHAAKTARLARKNCSASATELDQAAMDRELHNAALRYGARLTPNAIVMSRASFAAQRLSMYLNEMNAVGGMAEFNQEYKRRHHRATARGEKFISYNLAQRRLRRVLIRLLIDKKELEKPATFFDEVFSGTSRIRHE